MIIKSALYPFRSKFKIKTGKQMPDRVVTGSHEPDKAMLMAEQ